MSYRFAPNTCAGSGAFFEVVCFADVVARGDANVDVGRGVQGLGAGAAATTADGEAAGAGAGSDTGADADADADTGTGADTDTGTGTGSDADTDTDTALVADDVSAPRRGPKRMSRSPTSAATV